MDSGTFNWNLEQKLRLGDVSFQFEVKDNWIGNRTKSRFAFKADFWGIVGCSKQYLSGLGDATVQEEHALSSAWCCSYKQNYEKEFFFFLLLSSLPRYITE